MAAQFTAPLVGTNPTRKGQPQVGNLVTVLLRKGESHIECGARLERLAHGTAFVKLIGLTVPAPYKIGDRLPLATDKVVDW